MNRRVLVVASLVALLVLTLLGCSVNSESASQVTPIPTKTPRPLFTATWTPTSAPLSTDTPLPTDTPVPSTATPTPTDTPLLPTDTPVSPTDVPPADTPVPPTDTPPPVPTDTPRPQPSRTPAPPTNTPQPQVDFRVVEQRLMPKAENEAQLHSIWIRVTDADGNLLHEVIVWDANHPDQEALTGSKPDPYSAEYVLWSYDAYQLEVKGARSQKTKVLSTEVHLIPKEDLVAAGYCPDLNSCNADDLFQHYSWYVTFQRTW
jgi:hypothetical protein